MWHWWSGIISGNTPVLINPDRDKLLKRCFEGQVSTIKFHSHYQIGKSGILADARKTKLFLVDSFKLNHTIPISLSAFCEVKENILSRINVGKAHAYVLEKSLTSDHIKFLKLNVITTSPLMALIIEDNLVAPATTSSLGVFTMYTDKSDSESTVALSLETNELLVLGTPADSIMCYLQFLIDTMSDLFSANQKIA